MTNKEIAKAHLAQIDLELFDIEDTTNEARMAVWVMDNPMACYEDYKGMCLHFETMCVAREDWPIPRPDTNFIFP